ncbi:MAG: branched-chain amino acid ABC transporter permease [Deltaproteobacteria bacterium]|nr:branched-chain amino acid ABC transporter permease [Deltaproteobacteria bacterium]
MSRFHFHPCGNFKTSYEKELSVFETDFGRLWVIIGLIILYCVIPFVMSPYLIYILNIIGIYAITSIGLNLLIGYSGQISLGQGAFFGVGAYTAAILATKAGFPFLLAIPSAGIVTAGVGMIFGIPSIRLKHLYLCIATLAGQLIIDYLFVHWEGLTGGAEGIIISDATIFGIDISNDKLFYYIIFLCLVLAIWVAVNIIRTRFGRAFIAIRDNDRAAEGMGIPIFRYKLMAFAVSSLYAGFAGGLYAFYLMSVTPEPFNLWKSIEFIAMIIIGGLGSVSGSIFGTVFIVALNELLSHVTGFLMNFGATAGLAVTIAPLREFVFGLAIVLFILFEPKGLAEVWRVIRSSFRLWPFSY